MKRKDLILVVVAVLLIISGFFFGNKKEKVLTEEEQRQAWSDLIDTTKLEAGINNATFDYFEAVYNIKDEKTVVYIGRDSCSWCQKFSPIIESVAKENDFAVIYINTDKLTNREKQDLILASENHFTGGTPTTLVIEKGKVVDYLGGYVEKEDAISFFKKTGVIG